MGWLAIIAQRLVSPIAGFFRKREERKQTQVVADAKIKLAKLKKQTEITLTDAEWEAVSAKSQIGSWKDEYITLVVTSPIVFVFLGVVWLTFTGDERLLHSVLKGIGELKTIGVDMGSLIKPVVLAAVGLKVWRLK